MGIYVSEKDKEMERKSSDRKNLLHVHPLPRAVSSIEKESGKRTRKSETKETQEILKKTRKIQNLRNRRRREKEEETGPSISCRS